jgi:hypothetical protein
MIPRRFTGVRGSISFEPGVAVMIERLIAVAVVFDVALVIYLAVTIAQRACLRRARRHQWRADRSANSARCCRRAATLTASYAELAASEPARAFLRRRSEQLPRDALRLESSARRNSLRAGFWDFLS